MTAEDCAKLAERKHRRLLNTKRRRLAAGDKDGAKRASIGATIAAAIANEIRRANGEHTK